MARDCAVCGDLSCDCENCFPGYGSIAQTFGICRSCLADLRKLAGEGAKKGAVVEGMGKPISTADSRAAAYRVRDWLGQHPLPQRKSPRNTTQPTRAGVSS